MSLRYSIEQLEMLSAVAQRGSFSAAARHLGKAQSSVSSAIANLEIDLGFALFSREAKLPTLTEAGAQILKSAELILDQCLELESHAHRLAAVSQTSMTIAIEIPYNAVIEPLRLFSESFPHIDITIRTPDRGRVTELLLSRDVDLAISFAQSSYPRHIQFSQLGKLILTHVAHREHPLAGNTKISFLELKKHRRLTFSAHKNQLPTTEYLNANQIWQAESYLALLELVKANLGWATLPRQLIKQEIDSGELIELPLEAYPHTDWVLGIDLLWAKEAQMQPGTQWLKARLLEHKIFELDRNSSPTTL
ncbi:LysR family transcriptional regulator [Paenalcaligenes niemegkensis]|uniref:LysR family transcriptional regulator n=1 Tax=Paenalcaligenes niemegkensis TaxID=2895469 RepID=UPI001EE84478|nr:LysR family transcriptional regulator [Paenalcaligenes niemegkensis]MCQ9615582.1 LysR family transcriptional regulator [Paenalcaligenes niemegkensis]